MRGISQAADAGLGCGANPDQGARASVSLALDGQEDIRSPMTLATVFQRREKLKDETSPEDSRAEGGKKYKSSMTSLSHCISQHWGRPFLWTLLHEKTNVVLTEATSCEDFCYCSPRHVNLTHLDVT